ncbi:MAG: sigma-54-dependent Fis family transcriptional regulator [Myxococcota bacterium]|nr:sigma-54-dependent Fis family transcriptional regulator [Myxococcota bacterium]
MAEASHPKIDPDREATGADLRRIEGGVAAGDAEPPDLDRIARKIAAAGYDDLAPRLHAVQARLALRRGDADVATAAATGSLAAAQRRGDLEAQAEAIRLLAEAATHRNDRETAERRPAAHGEPAVPPAATAAQRAPTEAPARAAAGTAARDAPLRLLEINRRMVRESDVERLFEAIMDAAIEFTGAECGYLLLADAEGKMEVRRARQFTQVEVQEAHRRFSKSIAEQAYREGAPIVTLSAMDDERFRKAMSVYKMQLQSIICVPIRGRERTLGVLYLENRVRRGRFGEADRDLLMAFGDQVALAIENAALIDALRRRTRELEETRGKLEDVCAERERLLSHRTEQLERTECDLATARRALDAPHGFSGIVGESSAMRRVFDVVRRVLDADVSVVIVGESGTGKDVVARAIHTHGPRAKAAFVALNCGAFPEGLIEAELFGHARGAFTGAVRDKRGVFVEAHRGTLLLDEVGDMPARMQADLLRTLQEGTVRPLGSDREVRVDTRVLASTQQPLADLVAAGRFREDLMYRLNVVELRIPPLRERIEDLPLLVDHFLNAFAARFGVRRKTLARGVVPHLMSLAWPGNVRQLEHALLNAWVLSDSDVLSMDDFAAALEAGARASHAAPPAATGAAPAGRASFEVAERDRILGALRAAGWNKTRAAEALRIPRRTFYRKIARYGIDR